MKPRPHRRHPPESTGQASQQSGFALIVVILLMALLLSLGAVGARTAQVELKIAGNDLRSRQALEVAEAGLDHAVAALRLLRAGRNAASDGFNDELSDGGTSGGLTAVGTLTTLADGNAYRCNSLSQQRDGDGYCVRMVDNDDETAGADDPTDDLDNTVVLISRGSVANAERIVELRLTRAPVYGCVLCSNLDYPLLAPDVALLGGFSTDSFDSRIASYDAASSASEGHVIANGAVTMSGTGGLPVTVHGDLSAGADVQSLTPPTTVSGATRQYAAPTRFAPVPACGPPYPGNSGISGGLYDSTTGTLSNVGANEVIQLAGGPPDSPTQYCFGAIQMTGNSRLQTNGAVHLRLTRPSTLLGIVNATGIPADLRISSSVDQPPIFMPASPGLTIGGVAGQLTMVVDAPNAMVGFAGAISDFYGQLITGIPPTTGVTTHMHYDKALDTPQIFRRGWRELRNHPPS